MHAHGGPVVVQPPGADQSAAAVAPGAGENDDALSSRIAAAESGAGQVGKRAAGLAIVSANISLMSFSMVTSACTVYLA